MKTLCYYIDNEIDSSWKMLDYPIFRSNDTTIDRKEKHLNAYRYAVDMGVNILIVENDCILTERFPKNFFDYSDYLVLSRNETRNHEGRPKLSFKSYFVSNKGCQFLIDNYEKNMSLEEWFIEIMIDKNGDLNCKYVVAK